MLISVSKLIFKLVKYKCYIWLADYVIRTLKKREISNDDGKEIDVMVVMCDHFEPARWEGEEGVKRVRNWCEDYKAVSLKHTDSDGIMPQHTWFYRYDYPKLQCIQILSEYVYKDLGEIEFHLHHGYDTPSDFSKTLDEGLKWFNQVGAMLSAEEEPNKNFAYIAGNWALDNGRKDPAFSGVDKEISLLSLYRCYADFTFPAFGVSSQPRYANNIYYATDDFKPKSYNQGNPVRAGVAQNGDLMIFQGPLYIDIKQGQLEYASFEKFTPFLPGRLDYWLNADIHVPGRPEWKFIKLHTHGIQSQKMFKGQVLDELFTAIENKFMSDRFRLHYVTAREAYNIVKAAEAGKNGNPGKYRDFKLPMPVNRLINCDSTFKLISYSNHKIVLSLDEKEVESTLKFKDTCLKKIKCKGLNEIEINCDQNTLVSLKFKGDGNIKAYDLNNSEIDQSKIHRTGT